MQVMAREARVPPRIRTRAPAVVRLVVVDLRSSDTMRCQRVPIRNCGTGLRALISIAQVCTQSINLDRLLVDPSSQRPSGSPGAISANVSFRVSNVILSESPDTDTICMSFYRSCSRLLSMAIGLRSSLTPYVSFLLFASLHR